jgi:hypothetical protein
VIYGGRDPVTVKGRANLASSRDRAEAERLAAKLTATETDKVGAARALTFGVQPITARPNSKLSTTTWCRSIVGDDWTSQQSLGEPDEASPIAVDVDDRLFH